MKKILNHRLFILIGCLTWIVSFFGEILNKQPNSTVGILLSPIILAFGIYLWFKYYKKETGSYPNFIKKWKEQNRIMKNNPLNGLEYFFTHLFEIWTMIILFWITIFFSGSLLLGQSNAYKKTKQYCESHKEIINKTGKIKYYGFLISGQISTNGKSGTSDFTFTIIGE